jgi:hypothetical protein
MLLAVIISFTVIFQTNGKECSPEVGDFMYSNSTITVKCIARSIDRLPITLQQYKASTCYGYLTNATNYLPVTVESASLCLQELFNNSDLSFINSTNIHNHVPCGVKTCEILSGGKVVYNEDAFTQCITAYTAELFKKRIKFTPQFAKSIIGLCRNNSYEIHECIDYFIKEICLSVNTFDDSKFVCINQLFGLCKGLITDRDRSNCKRGIESSIDNAIKRICDSSTQDNCNFLLNQIIHQPIQFSSINRLASMLSGRTNKSRDFPAILNRTSLIIDHLKSNVSNTFKSIDQFDAENFMNVMDKVLDEQKISSYADPAYINTGTEYLQQLNQLNKIFGKAILTRQGRIKGNFSYFGSNLNVNFQIPHNRSPINFHYVSRNNMSVEILLPYEALCEEKYDKREATNREEEVMEHKRNSDEYYEEDYEEFEDIDDHFRNCYPSTFTDGCNFVVASFYAQNIETFFELSTNVTLLSMIISTEVISDSSIYDFDTFTYNLRENVSLKFNISEYTRVSNGTPQCHFWDMYLGQWSTEGVTTLSVSSTEVICTSNHLTSFAILIDHTGILDDDNTTVSVAEQIALSTLGYIGPVVSIIALILAITLLLIFRKKLDKGPLLYIHVNFCVSLLLALFVLVVGVESPRNVSWLCSFVAALMHYLFLSVFFWMLSEGIMLYMLIVKVFSSIADKWYLFLPLGWGTPLIVIIVSASIRYYLYGTESYCWLSSEEYMRWSFVGPIILIIGINVIFLFLTVIEIIKSRKFGGTELHVKNIDLVKCGVKGVIVLLPLLGITWIIGIFAVSDQTTVFLWLFTIFNSFQGVTILYFHVLRNKIIWRFFIKTLHFDRMMRKSSTSKKNASVTTLEFSNKVYTHRNTSIASTSSSTDGSVCITVTELDNNSTF